MKTNFNYARLMGVSFLLLIIFGFFGMAYVPISLYDYGSAAHTLTQVKANPQLLRYGILATVMMNASSLFLAIFTYRWLKKFSSTLAVSAALLLMTGAIISLVNELNNVSVLHFSQHSANLEMIALHLNLYQAGVFIATLFWGLWLLPVGYAFLHQSRWAKLIGILLIISGIGYMLDSLFYLLWYQKILVSDYTFLGEIIFTIWALFQRKSEFEPIQSALPEKRFPHNFLR
ncbi:DUF4386 domain-containing protein [Owenweeksia hongkongensis]|uniref:DUF4386 domain-containing protein n=1 Tax=Owenweeksia hongkongensis TaxID=253245 RepID=UPI003A935EA3